MSRSINYWDLSQSERAALSHDEVDRFVDFELMSKGVLKASPLMLEPEPAVPEPAETVYRIQHGRTYYTHSSLAFLTAESAEAFLALSPIVVDESYVGHDKIGHVETGSKMSIEVQQVLSAEQYLSTKSAFERLNAVRDANTKAKEAYEKAVKAQDAALNGLWADWYDCRQIDGANKRIVSTFRDYLTTAGDEALAGKFLLKVFGRPEIEAAAEWCQVKIPLPSENEPTAFPAVDLPVTPAPEAADAIVF